MDGMPDKRDNWDEHWNTFGGAARGNPANALRARLILSALDGIRPGSTVLDVGSGQGELALELKRAMPRCRVVGIEYSAEGVRRARITASEVGVDVEFLQGDLLDAATIPSLPERAACAVCSEVLEHLDKPEIFLANLRNHLLANEARLIITVPGGPRSAFDRHIGHRQHFTVASLRRLLASAGYEIQEIRRAGFPMFNLYKAVVMLRGRGLIADLSDEELTAGTTKLGQIVLAVFGRLMHYGLPDAPGGWQLFAVASPEGELT